MVGQVLYHIQDAEAFLQKAIVFFSTKAGDINIDVPAPKGYEKLANSEELFEQVSMRLLALGITGIPKDLVPLFSKIYRELNYYDYLIDEFLIVASRNIAGLGKLLEECRICFTMLKNDINLIKRPFNKLINSL